MDTPWIPKAKALCDQCATVLRFEQPFRHFRQKATFHRSARGGPGKIPASYAKRPPPPTHRKTQGFHQKHTFYLHGSTFFALPDLTPTCFGLYMFSFRAVGIGFSFVPDLCYPPPGLGFRSLLFFMIYAIPHLLWGSQAAEAAQAAHAAATLPSIPGRLALSSAKNFCGQCITALRFVQPFRHFHQKTYLSPIISPICATLPSLPPKTYVLPIRQRGPARSTTPISATLPSFPPKIYVLPIISPI